MGRLVHLVAALCVLGAAGPAWSADLQPSPTYPVKATPPYITPANDWSGFYAGVHAGGGLFRGSADNLGGAGGSTSLSGSGWLGGVQLGYNRQLGSWVLGLEGDWSYTDIRGTTATPNLQQTNRIDWIGTITGRAGITWDRALLYVKGGAAYGDVRSEATVPMTMTAAGNSDRLGWTVGAGVEWGWLNNWSVKAEYDYVDLGTRTVTLTSPSTGLSLAEDAKATAHMIKLGANYRFRYR